jgi:undecaprenyl-diphosphatase
MNFFEAIVLAIIEGLTEFLPVSSTGHIIIGSSLMGIAADPFVKMFTVCIQFGAILSVVVMYFNRFFKSIDFYAKLFCAFIPTALLGLLLKKHVDALLENVTVVGISLLAGGIILVFIDKVFEQNEKNPDNAVTYKKGFVIGFFQAISMIPGVSRSAATIIGGLTQKLDRKTAAEFSFFLAVPTMFAATVKSMYDVYKDTPELLASSNISILLLGNSVAFLVAMLAIKFFIGILTKYGFKIFGYYRIAVGALILILYFCGVQLTLVD